MAYPTGLLGRYYLAMYPGTRSPETKDNASGGSAKRLVSADSAKRLVSAGSGKRLVLGGKHPPPHPSLGSTKVTSRWPKDYASQVKKHEWVKKTLHVKW